MNLKKLMTEVLSPKEQKQAWHILNAIINGKSANAGFRPIAAETSWGFPLIEGETEVREGIIRRKDSDVDIVVVDKTFHKSKGRYTTIKVDDLEQKQELYTGSEDWFASGLPKLMEVMKEYGMELDVRGYLVFGTKDRKPYYFIYNENEAPELDASGKNAVYFGRAVVGENKDQVLDSSSVFCNDCESAAGRGQRAADSVASRVDDSPDGRGAFAVAFERVFSKAR
ncbi:MAG: hypothetical protein LBG89_02420 [Rickettsiales bacterium]|jgi:hypothetical protein|nr:hypothetical protein [Rickettsiales bacterium]